MVNTLDKWERKFLQTATADPEADRPMLELLNQPEDGLAISTDRYRIHMVDKEDRIAGVDTIEDYPDVCELFPEETPYKVLLKDNTQALWKAFALLAKRPYCPSSYTSVTLSADTEKEGLVIDYENMDGYTASFTFSAGNISDNWDEEFSVACNPRFMWKAVKLMRKVHKRPDMMGISFTNDPLAPFKLTRAHTTAWILPMRTADTKTAAD